MEKFSKTTWLEAESIYVKIINHPFNIELSQGSLCNNKFAYYIEQDTLYLNDYYRALSVIASKLPTKFGLQFLKHATTCIEVENSLHKHLSQNLKLSKFDNTKNMANLAYSSYLLQTCYSQSVEVALASILPCFWIYNEVGKNIIKNTKNLDTNPYKNWIETYSDEDFSNAMASVIEIYDEFAKNASLDTRTKMLEAYKTGAVLEYHFWDKAYNRVDLFDI